MPTDTNQNILGSGWSFHVRKDGRGEIALDGRGGIALSQHDKDIEEAIHVILSTAKGERRMRPEFGCEVHNLVFAPNNETTWGLASRYVKEALGWWEPRIEVTDVDTRPDPLDTSILLINIKYRIKSTNDARNIVYPFYLLLGRV